MISLWSISRKLLNEGEHVVLSTRTHVKALFLPAVVLILRRGARGVPVQPARAGTTPGLALGDLGIAAIAGRLVRGRAVPDWLVTTYTFTNRRLITRTGILTRRGHDIPMNRISDISYEKGVIDRMFGCGTLVVSDASEQGRVPLKDIPHVEQAQLTVSDELFHRSARTQLMTDPEELERAISGPPPS